MIRSNVQYGQIYAGNTPLASTIAVVQTAPMQLTVRAGSFTTTGQSKIVDVPEYSVITPDVQKLIDLGAIEFFHGNRRARIWSMDGVTGKFRKAQTFTLAADQVFNLTSDAVDAKAYQAELGIDLSAPGSAIPVDVLIRSRILPDGYPPIPIATWETIHQLIFEFVVPPGTVDLSAIDIFVLNIISGFPEGTSGQDWLTQSGAI